MVKISDTHHRTKTGVIKKNPVSNRIEIIPSPYKKDPDRKQKLMKLERWIDNVNSHAWVPFKKSQLPVEWFSRRVTRFQDSQLWNNLSYPSGSEQFFKKPSALDPTHAVLWVNVDFLSRHKGNQLSDIKRNHVNEAIRKKEKMSVPIWDEELNSVAEGNHRVEKMRQLGFKSIPIMIAWN